MSFVRWYSVVAFQCLKEWKVILSNRGFCNFLVNLFLWFLKLIPWAILLVFSKTLMFLWGRAFSIVMSFLLTLNYLGVPCFSGVHVTVQFSSSTSIHSRFHASPIRIPVSFSNWRLVATFFPHPAIRASISFSFYQLLFLRDLANLLGNKFSRKNTVMPVATKVRAQGFHFTDNRPNLNSA